MTATTSSHCQLFPKSTRFPNFQATSNLNNLQSTWDIIQSLQNTSSCRFFLLGTQGAGKSGPHLLNAIKAWKKNQALRSTWLFWNKVFTLVFRNKHVDRLFAWKVLVSVLLAPHPAVCLYTTIGHSAGQTSVRSLNENVWLHTAAE